MLWLWVAVQGQPLDLLEGRRHSMVPSSLMVADAAVATRPEQAAHILELKEVATVEMAATLLVGAVLMARVEVEQVDILAMEETEDCRMATRSRILVEVDQAEGVVVVVVLVTVAIAVMVSAQAVVVLDYLGKELMVPVAEPRHVQAPRLA